MHSLSLIVFRTFKVFQAPKSKYGNSQKSRYFCRVINLHNISTPSSSNQDQQLDRPILSYLILVSGFLTKACKSIQPSSAIEVRLLRNTLFNVFLFCSMIAAIAQINPCFALEFNFFIYDATKTCRFYVFSTRRFNKSLSNSKSNESLAGQVSRISLRPA